MLCTVGDLSTSTEVKDSLNVVKASTETYLELIE